MKYLTLLFLLCSASLAFGEAIKKEDLVDKRYVLVDDKVLEVYRFYSNGVAFAQFGKKGGSIAAPTWQWKIEEGFLVISASEGEKYRYELVERQDGFIKLKRRTGEVVRFEVQKLN